MMLRLLFHKFSKINTGDIKSILKDIKLIE